MHKIICIDPGHGGTAQTDHYRVGVNGEREEWINLRVAFLLKKMLEDKGAKVILTRTADQQVELPVRAAIAVDNKADAFISIHHNAIADRSVNFPIIYFHGAASENIAGVELGKYLALAFKKDFYKEKKIPVSIVSDYTVFPVKGAGVLRNSYGIPGVLAEASFFSDPAEELKLKQEDHNKNEATAYTHALEAFFSTTVSAIKPKKVPLELPICKVNEEAGRMSAEALTWKDDFIKGQKLLNKKDTASLRAAYDLFMRSARSFPDSYLAQQCHINLALILEKLNRNEEAKTEKIRAKELYIKVEL